MTATLLNCGENCLSIDSVCFKILSARGVDVAFMAACTWAFWWRSHLSLRRTRLCVLVFRVCVSRGTSRLPSMWTNIYVYCTGYLYKIDCFSQQSNRFSSFFLFPHTRIRPIGSSYSATRRPTRDDSRTLFISLHFCQFYYTGLVILLAVSSYASANFRVSVFNKHHCYNVMLLLNL